ncbi:hypothetical protein BC831DRAFT_443152, partial [Entophlyctis helioformis]
LGRCTHAGKTEQTEQAEQVFTDEVDEADELEPLEAASDLARQGRKRSLPAAGTATATATTKATATATLRPGPPARSGPERQQHRQHQQHQQQHQQQQPRTPRPTSAAAASLAVVGKGLGAGACCHAALPGTHSHLHSPGAWQAQLEQRLADRLKKERDDLDAKRREAILKDEAAVKAASAALLARYKSSLALYIRTTASPSVCFLPAKHNDATRRALDLAAAAASASNAVVTTAKPATATTTGDAVAEDNVVMDDLPVAADPISPEPMAA